jgi:hypothetical protein
MRSERFRGAEAAGVVDREVGHGPDAGDGHRTAPDVRALGRRGKGPIHRLSFPNEAPIRHRIQMELETRPQTGRRCRSRRCVRRLATGLMLLQRLGDARYFHCAGG